MHFFHRYAILKVKEKLLLYIRSVFPLNREEKIVKLKIDIIFKRVFGNDKNEEIIAAFISDMLDIPRSRITKVAIKNVELPPE